MFLFGSATATGAKIVQATNPRAEFVEAGVDRIATPAKQLFGLACVSLTILDSHLGLKLPSGKSHQLPRRRQNGFLHRCS